MSPKSSMTIRSRALALSCALLSVFAVCLAQPPGSATSRFELIRQQLRASRARNDWPDNLRYAQSLLELLNGAPGSQLEVARAELQLHHTEAGLRYLAVYARMGQA